MSTSPSRPRSVPSAPAPSPVRRMPRPWRAAFPTPASASTTRSRAHARANEPASWISSLSRCGASSIPVATSMAERPSSDALASPSAASTLAHFASSALRSHGGRTPPAVSSAQWRTASSLTANDRASASTLGVSFQGEFPCLSVSRSSKNCRARSGCPIALKPRTTPRAIVLR